MKVKRNKKKKIITLAFSYITFEGQCIEDWLVGSGRK